MTNDYRGEAAHYYDLWADPYDDAGFYLSQLPDASCDVLELGCGTGRVLLPMIAGCRFIQGIDLSPSMLAICQQKLDDRGIPLDRAKIDQGDITKLQLGRTFDVITAPFRVMQNLDTDQQVDGLLTTIRRHLAPGGRAFLNTFKPRDEKEDLYAFWSSRDGSIYTEKQTPRGLIRLSDDCRRFQKDPLIVFPILRYELIEHGKVIDSADLPVSMRVWYPDELIERITSAGFRILDRWGGYSGEAWGEGPELVVAFGHA